MHFETLAIHAGQEPDPLTGAVVPPIYQTSTYKQDGVGGLRGGYEYSRSANPTRTALEECLAAIEGGRRGLAFASGLAAEDTLLRAICRPGDHAVIPGDAYGGSYRYASSGGNGNNTAKSIVMIPAFHSKQQDVIWPNTILVIQ
jgi:cystathionine gamma-synthase